MNLGDRIKYLLDVKNIKQKDFAETLNISPSTMNGYIKNNREPDYEMLKKIAENLSVSTDYLLGLSPAENKENEKNLIQKFSFLDNNQKEILESVIEIMLKQNGYK